RPRACGHRGCRGRRRRHLRRSRVAPGRAPRRPAARDGRTGAHVPRDPCVLGPGAAGPDHSGGGGRRCAYPPPPWRPTHMTPSVRALAALVAIEIALFAMIGSNFLTVGNAREIARASADGGLLALALTPVILTGGIDLSVGSLMGLSAVTLGVL